VGLLGFLLIKKLSLKAQMLAGWDAGKLKSLKG
jgi:hypothetical protein